jgi:RNA polymerase sigma factor (sigma-70 family)
LCRKVQAITRRQSLGSWLYKVAYRICLRARAVRRRQPVELPPGVEPATVETIAPLALQELRAVLDEELNCLPEKYRAPLVLHYLEGKTVEQVAAELGWAYGTVCSRLTRGKDRLRIRLIKRGVTLSAGAAAALAQEAAAALPTGLAQATVLAVVAPTGSGQAAALAHALLRAESLNRLKWALAVVLMLGSAAGAGLVLSRDVPEPNAGAAPASVVNPLAGVDRNGDPLPEGALLRLGSARFRFADRAVAAAFAPDGRTFTTVGQQGLVNTWDADTGRPVSTFHLPGLTPAALSADGEFVAVYEPQTVNPYPTGGRIRLRRVSDAGTRPLLVVPPEAKVNTLAFSADGKRVAAGGHFDSLLVWDVTSGKLIRQLPAPGWNVLGSQLQVGLSPDGNLLAAFDSHPTIRLWDVETGNERRPLLIEGGLFSVFTFSRDGRVLVCGNLAGQISLWDTQSGELLRCFSVKPNPASPERVEPAERRNGIGPRAGSRPNSDPPRRGVDGVSNLALSSDGKLIACCCDHVVRVWDASGQARELFPQVDVMASPAIPLAFSPDNRFLLGGDSTSQIKVWKTATGRSILPDNEVDLDPNKDFSCFAAVSPNDSIAATFSARLIQLWDVRTGRKIGAVPAGDVEGRMSKPITFSADGKYLLRPYHKVKLADGLSGQTKGDAAWTLFPWPRPPGVNDILLPHFGGLYNDFRIVRRVATESVPISPRFGKLRPIALSPDEKTVAWAGDKASYLVLSDWKSAKEVSRVTCPGPCRSASFAPDGMSLAVAGESYVGLWDVRSGGRIMELAEVSNEPFSGYVESYRPLAFSPDGRFLAAGDQDCNVRLWNVATSKTAAVLKGHGGPILSLAFFADNRRLISGSADSTALIWDIARLQKERDP